MKKRLAAIGTVFLCLLFSACGRGSGPRLERSQLLGIDDVICSWGEAQVFILTQYTAYGREYGDSVWSVTLSEGNFESYIRDSLLEYLKTMLLAVYAAEQIGVSLSESEQRAVELAADSLYSDLGDAAGRFLILKDAVRSAYTHYLMAQIFYRQTVTDARMEISDEEARVISLQIVECPAEQGYEQAEVLAEKLKNTQSVSETLKDFEGVSVRTENVTRGSYSVEFETIVFALKQDQWSPVITEDGKYILVRCLSPYLATETNQHKTEMASAAREESLNKALKSYARTAQLIYNPDLWAGWSMEQYSSAPPVDFFRYTAGLEK
ncbi:MAG: peptidyl-prolyl cis-trans isomerase [Lachnospiraceae bacterium]|nr:peptidyl-prolyl cis-trans isomerase [Lachnospiraceae bacterium]